MGNCWLPHLGRPSASASIDSSLIKSDKVPAGSATNFLIMTSHATHPSLDPIPSFQCSEWVTSAVTDAMTGDVASQNYYTSVSITRRSKPESLSQEAPMKYSIGDTILYKIQPLTDFTLSNQHRADAYGTLFAQGPGVIVELFETLDAGATAKIHQFKGVQSQVHRFLLRVSPLR